MCLRRCFILSYPFFQEMGLKVNQEASFAVQLNGARGVIDAKVHTPSGAMEECYITELDNGEPTKAHTCSPAIYLVNVVLRLRGNSKYSIQTWQCG